jgi:hypothetical protein
MPRVVQAWRKELVSTDARAHERQRRAADALRELRDGKSSGRSALADLSRLDGGGDGGVDLIDEPEATMVRSARARLVSAHKGAWTSEG